MPPPVPRGPPALPAPPRRLIYDILRGPRLSGSDCITSYFYAQAQLQCQSFANTDAPRGRDLLPTSEEQALSGPREDPRKDRYCVFTKGPKAAIVRHRGGPSQLKEQADRGVNLSPMLMRSRGTFKGPEYQLRG